MVGAIKNFKSDVRHAIEPFEKLTTKQHINNKARRSRLHFFGKLVQTILLSPLVKSTKLLYRSYESI